MNCPMCNAKMQKSDYKSIDFPLYAKGVCEWKCPCCNFMATTSKILSRESVKSVSAENPVDWFAEQMKNRLPQNKFDGSWQGKPYIHLLQDLMHELEELIKACSSKNDNEEIIIVKSVDVANFVMMIADNAFHFIPIRNAITEATESNKTESKLEEDN